MIVESISAYTLSNLFFYYIYGKYKRCRLLFGNNTTANVNAALA